MVSKAFIVTFAAMAAVQAWPSPNPSSDLVFETVGAIPDGAWLAYTCKFPILSPIIGTSSSNG